MCVLLLLIILPADDSVTRQDMDVRNVLLLYNSIAMLRGNEWKGLDACVQICCKDSSTKAEIQICTRSSLATDPLHCVCPKC